MNSFHHSGNRNIPALAILGLLLCFTALTQDNPPVLILHQNFPALEPPGFSTRCIESCAKLADVLDEAFLQEQHWKSMLKGLALSLLLGLASSALGLILAALVCRLLRARHICFRFLGQAFVALWKQPPLLILILIGYFISTAQIGFDGLCVCTLAFGFTLAAYLGELLNISINKIPKAQKEAALALGFPPVKAFHAVILPQAQRNIRTQCCKACLIVLKAAFVIGYLTFHDLPELASCLQSHSNPHFFPLLANATIYFALGWLLVSCLALLEHKLAPKHRRESKEAL